MKPKNKFQKTVDATRKYLRPATEKQINWALENCFQNSGILTKHKAFCLECGHQWKQAPTLVATIAGCTCPSCGRDLKTRYSRNRKFEECSYFAIVTTVRGYQVIRTFFLDKFTKVGTPSKKICTEVMQHWIDSNGKYCFYSIAANSMGYGAYDRWIWGTGMELRDHETRGASWRSSIIPNRIYPKSQVLPEVKRNGFEGKFHEFSPFQFIVRLLTDSRTETLLKASQISLLRYYFERWDYNRFDKYWNSIKICIRNGYTVQKATTWIDYIELLSYFNKDLLSSHYVCPVNLKGAHDKLVKKKRDIEKRARLEEMREKLESSQAAYEAHKGKFFGLAFGNGQITIKVLESVREVMEEGDLLKHCVFAASYYNKPDSLLMSARIDGQPIETIELSLSTLKILQARGQNNQATEHHAEIIDLVSQNMRMITARMKQIPA